MINAFGNQAFTKRLINLIKCRGFISIKLNM